MPLLRDRTGADGDLAASPRSIRGPNGLKSQWFEVPKLCRLLTIYTRRSLIASMPKTALSAPAQPSRAAAHTDHGTTIALVQSTSLPMLVQQALERMILSGELAAGGKLNEAAIAERLGVSRGPVREAFRALEESGLVRLEKNRGVFVRQISIEEADEIYEVRAILDEWAGRTLAQRATAQQVEALRALVERMGKAAVKNDVDLYYHLNLDLHDAVVAFAGNNKLLETYRRLVKELSLFRRESLAQGGTMPVSTREHRDIIDRIAAGDVDGAGEAMRAHVTASRARMHKARGVDPSPGDDPSHHLSVIAPRRR
jgi:phosphonate utilization transcriptional regulator